MDDNSTARPGQHRLADVLAGSATASRPVDQTKVRLSCEAMKAGAWKLDPKPLAAPRDAPRG